jgi:hypothetical protein
VLASEPTELLDDELALVDEAPPDDEDDALEAAEVSPLEAEDDVAAPLDEDEPVVSSLDEDELVVSPVDEDEPVVPAPWLEDDALVAPAPWVDDDEVPAPPLDEFSGPLLLEVPHAANWPTVASNTTPSDRRLMTILVPMIDCSLTARPVLGG